MIFVIADISSLQPRPRVQQPFPAPPRDRKGKGKGKGHHKGSGERKGRWWKVHQKAARRGMGDRGKVLDAIVQELSRFFGGMFPQTVCLTLGVLTVIVKGRVPRSRWRTDFVAIFVVSCLHVRFSSLFTYFRACRARRDRLLNVNFRSFRLFNFFDVRFSW